VLPRDQEVLWAVGFIEGEGTIYMNDRNGKGSIVIQVGQTSVLPLERLQALWGGKIDPMKVNPRYSPAWRWRAASWRAAQVIREIMPYLTPGHTRHEQAVRALACRAAQEARGSVKMPPAI
jgi:hypothetical protein